MAEGPREPAAHRGLSQGGLTGSPGKAVTGLAMDRAQPLESCSPLLLPHHPPRPRDTKPAAYSLVMLSGCPPIAPTLALSSGSPPSGVGISKLCLQKGPDSKYFRLCEPRGPETARGNLYKKRENKCLQMLYRLLTNSKIIM